MGMSSKMTQHAQHIKMSAETTPIRMAFFFDTMKTSL
jgi:hypothetical protein